MENEGYSYFKHTSIRELCNLLAVNDEMPILDKSLMILFSSVSTSSLDSDFGILLNLHKKCKKHFEKLLGMRGSFFEGFILFIKSEKEGMLVGIGTDERFYAIAAWDSYECDLWEPEEIIHYN
ncbi:MAG: hypothetical protein WC671_00390 [Candidatus Paceibacterota bacterium]